MIACPCTVPCYMYHECWEKVLHITLLYDKSTSHKSDVDFEVLEI